MTTSEMNERWLERIAQQFFAMPDSARNRALELLANRGLSPGALPIVRGIRPEKLPLSYAQRRLWALWEMAPDSAAYNITTAVGLWGRLDGEALERSFEALVRRHEALRTRVESEDGEAYQVIDGPGGVAIEWEDLCAEEEAKRREVARARIRVEGRRPFDLGRGPLLRIQVLKLSEEEHVLSLVQHHIVSDAWSMGVLVEELVELYGAYTTGRAPELKELPVQYADYAVWQRQWLASGELERQLEYWKKELGEEHPVLELPCDRRRAGVRSSRGGQQGFEVGVEVVRGLRSLAERNGATLFMVLLSAWQVLLYRYTGQREIRVGVPHANRNRAELEGLIGFFVNTHVLRARLSGDEGFLEVLAQVKEASLGAQAHQDLPFEQLVEALNPERSLSHHPLFQALHEHGRRGLTGMRNLKGLRVESFEDAREIAHFDLALHTAEDKGGLLGTLSYATELFDAETAEQITKHYSRVLEGVVKSPTERIGRLVLWSDEERSALVRQASAGKSEAFESVPYRFERHARSSPEAVAVWHEEDALSQAGLRGRARALGHRLRELGVQPEERVGVWATRSTELVVGICGVWQAGGAYVGLDPKLPVGRLRELVKSGGLRVVVGGAEAGAKLAGVGVEVVDVGGCADAPATFEGYEPSESQAAYVLYTSGSTGVPKGVVVTHGGLSNYVEGVLSRLGVSETASFALVTTASADLGNTVLMGALSSGRTLHVLSEARVFDPDSFGRYMSEHQVGVLKITPSHLRGLLSGSEPERVLPREALVLGGEASSWELVDEVQRCGVCRIFNHYGPTETTVGVVSGEYRAEHRERSRTLPLGRELSGSRAYVLDAELEPVPAGVAGEVYLGGAGVARGYLEQGGWTAERFVPDPYGQEGERLYRTGDRARRLRSGELEFLGRWDEQVKVRGYRVELGEVKASLREVAGVSDAEVLVAEGRGEATRLVAYVVTTEERLPSILDAARARLPDYMLPSQWVVLSELPLTSNGKVDRRMLTRLQHTRPASGDSPTDVERPLDAASDLRTDVERQLAQIWRDVLGVERVGPGDNFFDLGGDSILLLKVIGRAKRIGMRLIPGQVFEAQTLRALAACITHADVPDEPKHEESDLLVIGAKATGS